MANSSGRYYNSSHKQFNQSLYIPPREPHDARMAKIDQTTYSGRNEQILYKILDEKDWCKYRTLSSHEEKLQNRMMESISRNLQVMSGKLSADGCGKQKKGSSLRTFAPPRQLGTASRARKFEQRQWAAKIQEKVDSALDSAEKSDSCTTPGCGKTELLLGKDAVKYQYNRSMDVIVQLYNEKLHLEHQLGGGEGPIRELVVPLPVTATTVLGTENGDDTPHCCLLSKNLQSDIDRYTRKTREVREQLKCAAELEAKRVEDERLHRLAQTNKRFPKRMEKEEERNKRRSDIRQQILTRKQEKARQTDLEARQKAYEDDMTRKREEAARNTSKAISKRKEKAPKQGTEAMMKVTDPPAYETFLSKANQAVELNVHLKDM